MLAFSMRDRTSGMAISWLTFDALFLAIPLCMFLGLSFHGVCEIGHSKTEPEGRLIPAQIRKESNNLPVFK